MIANSFFKKLHSHCYVKSCPGKVKPLQSDSTFSYLQLFGKKQNNNCFFISVLAASLSFIAPTYQDWSVLTPQAIFPSTDLKKAIFVKHC